MYRNKLCLSLLFLVLGCTKNNPIIFKDFQALRCELNIKEKIYNDYIFNKNTGDLYYYDEINDEFIKKSKKFKSDNLIEYSSEFFSVIKKNNLLVTNIEYYKDSNEIQKFIKKKDMINLKSLIRRSIIKYKNGEYLVSKGKCIWIDPKLGLRY